MGDEVIVDEDDEVVLDDDAEDERFKFGILSSEILVICSLGTDNGLIRDLITGGTLLEEGKTGELAQSAALVNWVTNENECDDGVDVVRNALLNFDFIPPELLLTVFISGGCNLPLIKCGPNSGSLPQFPYDVVLSNKRCLDNFSITSAHT